MSRDPMLVRNVDRELDDDGVFLPLNFGPGPYPPRVEDGPVVQWVAPLHGYFPTQAWGYVGDRWFYYRARHDASRVLIGPRPGNTAIPEPAEVALELFPRTRLIPADMEPRELHEPLLELLTRWWKEEGSE